MKIQANTFKSETQKFSCRICTIKTKFRNLMLNTPKNNNLTLKFNKGKVLTLSQIESVMQLQMKTNNCQFLEMFYPSKIKGLFYDFS